MINFIEISNVIDGGHEIHEFANSKKINKIHEAKIIILLSVHVNTRNGNLGHSLLLWVVTSQ